MESDAESVISEFEEEVYVDPSNVQEEIILDEKDRDNVDLDEDMDDDPTSDARDSAPAPQDDSVSCFTGHTDSVYSVSLHPSNEYVVTGGGDDRAFLWNVKDGTQIFELGGHKDTVSQAKFNFDGKLIGTGSYDGTVKIWDVPTGKLLANLEGPSDLIETICWHPKGNAILAGSQDCTIWMWMASGAFMNMFSGHKGSVTIVTFTSDGKLVLSGSEDGSVRVWDPKNATAVATLEGYGFHEGGPITSLATHATNANVVLTGSQDSTICMSNISTGKPLGMLKNHNDTVESVAFSNGFPWFASGSLDKTISVFDANTLQQRGICNHDDGVVKVQWHPSQPLLFSASTDKTVKLWDARSGEAVRVWRGHKDTILDFALSSDGSFVVTAGDDQASLVFKV